MPDPASDFDPLDKLSKTYEESILSCSEQKERRWMRKAIQNRDAGRVRVLLDTGYDVNMIISEVFWDTPLTYSIKYGYLEVVETLVGCPKCQLDHQDRNKHFPMDEALKGYLSGANSTVETKHNLSKRYRIIRCLLKFGAKKISPTFLDMLIHSTLASHSGHSVMKKTVKLFRRYGNHTVKTALLCSLLSCNDTAPYVASLLSAGANPEEFLQRKPSRPIGSLDNAVALLRATNDPKMLKRIDMDSSSNTLAIDAQWTKYRRVLLLLSLSGYEPPLHVLNYLYRCHASVYSWVASYTSTPKPLSHLSRVEVRSALGPNVVAGLKSMKKLPEFVKPFVLFQGL